MGKIMKKCKNICCFPIDKSGMPIYNVYKEGNRDEKGRRRYPPDD